MISLVARLIFASPSVAGVTVSDVSFTDEDSREGWMSSVGGISWTLPDDMDGVMHLEAFILNSPADDPDTHGQLLQCCDLQPAPLFYRGPEIPASATACSPGLVGCPQTAQGTYPFRAQLPTGEEGRARVCSRVQATVQLCMKGAGAGGVLY